MAKTKMSDRQTGKPLSKIGGFEAPHELQQPGSQAGPIERAFFSASGLRVQKWHHYLPIYDRYFGEVTKRERPIRLLEIGVKGGGSVQMWRKFFGPDAIIFGIDIEPECKNYEEESGAQIRIGSQDDPDFLERVVDEMGGIDVVLDDGSHHSDHVNRSFNVLFSMLADKGLYIVEDLHAAYWDRYRGGLQRPGTFIESVKDMIDDMHRWYHHGEAGVPSSTGHVSAIHIHDSLIVIEKDDNLRRPIHSTQMKRQD